MAETVEVAATQEATPARYIGIGLIGGLFSGLLGIGGGTVMVPLMVLLLGTQQKKAHALSLGAIIPISIVAVAVYGGAGKVNPAAAGALTVGAIFGARIGANLLANSSERRLKACFGIFVLIAAVLMVVEG
ncbi:MAG: sulfite exporter TauE/SafE family protein [Thermoleophilia bacterium]|nr:sulfite exporter TauE/SafE family protein [Thermoleophilia bacterium]